VERTIKNGNLSWEFSSGYKNGKQNGKVIAKIFGEERIECEYTILNGNKEGWEICKKYGSIDSKKYYKNGIESPENGRSADLEGQKKECVSLGYRDNTPEMGSCILKLRELELIKNTSPNNSNPAQIKKEVSESEKINALNMLLQSVQQISGAGQSNSSNAKGIICTKLSEKINGIYKSCIYNCAGATTSTTVRSVDSCPSNTNF
jgi:hypothetical protein